MTSHPTSLPPSEACAERFAATSGQARLWLIDRLDPSSGALHLCIRTRLRDNLTTDQLIEAHRWFAARHQAFRSRLRGEGSRLWVEVDPEPPALECYEACDASEADAIALRVARCSCSISCAAAERPWGRSPGPARR